MRRLAVFVWMIMLVGMLAAGCATGDPAISGPAASSHADSTGEATAEATGAAGSGALTPITLFLGYIPNVQFAPVYVALDQGFFRDEGIDLSLEHGFDETDGLTRIATGNLQFGMISGEQVLLARSQGAPVKYVFRWYQRFPVAVVAAQDSGITTPGDLRGKVVGVPGLYGASYIGLRALLNAAGLQESDLGRVEAIGFDTVPVFCDKRVEAAVVYIANEPAQIEAACTPVSVIPVADYANLVSNGLVTNEQTIAAQPELVRGMANAFARGLQRTIDDPDLAYQVSRKYVESLGDDDPLQRIVLERSIELWRADRLGQSDAETWQRAADTLAAMGLIVGETAPDVAAAFTNDFVPAQAE
ncbi:MAG: ABC transporter substrate-binding protein [Anaerolineae bacterium]|nr:ABC transporter substrate-binding protein [Anaerolineae bacterium]